MCVREVVLSDVVARWGYSTGGAASLLMLGRNTLAFHVAMGTLGAWAAPTLGAVLSDGIVGDTIARRSRIAVRKVKASSAVAGTVPSSARRTQNGDVVQGDGWCGAMAWVKAPRISNTISLHIRHQCHVGSNSRRRQGHRTLALLFQAAQLVFCCNRTNH